MKTVKLSGEELHALRQVEAYKKLVKIAKGEYKIFAEDQYLKWCEFFINSQ